MTTIDELAETILTTHDLADMDAARQVVTVHIDEIRDDEDLWHIETQSLTATGAEVVTQAIAESYRQGLYGTEAQRLLDDIADTTRALDAARTDVVERETDRDDLIRRAMRSELRPKDIAAASGLKPARLYQIRDGRR